MSGYGGYGAYYAQPGTPAGGYPTPGGNRDLNTIQLARPDFSSLAPFEKNFYIEHPAVAARNEADVQAYRQLREIHVEGAGIPKPVVTFDEASFPGQASLEPVWFQRGSVYTPCALLSLEMRKTGPCLRQGLPCCSQQSMRLSIRPLRSQVTSCVVTGGHDAACKPRCAHKTEASNLVQSMS